MTDQITQAAAQTQIFFFISAIGFVILGILTAILLFYLIRFSRTFSRIIDKAESDINKLGDATKEILDEMRESRLFEFLFKVFKKKKKRNS
jgi:hypothetical protein